MKYAVDKIIEDIVVLENIESGEIIEINKKKLPDEIHEGSIVIVNDEKYELDVDEENTRRESLRARLDRLKNLNK